MSGPQPLRIGVIGAGFMAQVAHIYSFALIPGVEIGMIAEPHRGLCDGVADRFGIRKRAGDYRDLLDDPDVQAVVVSVPRHAQAPIVEQALTAKAFVLSEKPLAMTVAQARRMIEIAEAKRRIWAVGYMKRYDPGVVRFRNLLAEVRTDRRWGEVIDVTMRDFCGTYAVPIPPHIRRESARPARYVEVDRAPDFVHASHSKDYDYTVNVLSHDINLLRWLFPDLAGARAFSVQSGRSQRAVLAGGGFEILLTAGPADIGRWDQTLDVTFQRGRLTLNLPSPMALQQSARIIVSARDGTQTLEVAPSEQRWAFHAQAVAFVDAIARCGMPAANGRDSLDDLILIEDLWRIVDWNQ